ncbi:MAG: 30S ribosomal protein S9 [Spirochaetia bacterium]|jgi:small subunit ribosomal protein S9|uniref:30S ribosomal protein S9 n=1 Tax=bioreactor metagenome TaxID=1076179 RepID=A0A644UEA7_9ZZZZ|nr:30S ribosomal protein S9 [Spirochaetia bacterium]MCE1208009.1 30S ribosomal protein S9 [Spirochaetia bacterium]NLX44740.1 30S ribosomal protein S9 [Treponema sp.]VBB40637.1 30S ribosomal subunit protein S9 [uncultured Spirochaetota bacterium]HOI22671.1 30S ribosomal protein S9 [Spirochaetales bacterium]
MVRNLGIGTGRRKCAIARVFLREGTGKIMVNDVEATKYFKVAELAAKVMKPLIVTSSENKYDVLVTVVGGGVNGQAGACAHGLSRALAQVDPGNHEVLRANGLLTRDPRMVERKKYGQRGARRRFQFSKR